MTPCLGCCPYCGESVVVDRVGLTSRQRDLLSFIKEAIKSNGVAPSFEEMRIGMGYKSKAAVHAMVDRLEARGAIRRIIGFPRSIVVMEAA